MNLSVSVKSFFSVLTLLLEFWVRVIESRECAPCELRSCPRVIDCGSDRVLVRDPCGCCDQCSRLEMELCGGTDWTLGYCGSGLTCTDLNGTGPVLVPDAGVCKVVPDGGDEDVGCPLVSGCDRVNDECVCESKRSCVRTFTYPNRDACVRTERTGSRRHEHKHKKLVGSANGSCVFSGCNLTEHGCVCSSQSCYDNFMYNNQTQCQQAAEKLKCADVICPPLVTPECPSDSELKHISNPSDECCPTISSECTCSQCSSPPQCNGSQKLVQLTQSDGTPGNCCHTYTCQRVSSRCVYNGDEYGDGDVYRMDSCWVCQCRGGISFCSKAECAEVDCENFYIPDGECCPVCTVDVELLSVESTKASCWVNDRLRSHEEQWKEDDCTFCQCVDGEPHCTAMACKLSCQNPVKIPGECCPFCEEPSYETVSPVICPRLENCSLSGGDCPLGFQQDHNGCLLCQCVNNETCPDLSSSCSLDCAIGYEKDVNSCDVCECKRSRVKCGPVTCSKICPHGFLRNKHGCEMCRCVKCPPFTCNKHCSNGYTTNKKGCSLCECKDVNPVDGSVCVTSDGGSYKDGESWHDGCRDCYCNSGREMCVLISCPVPSCPHPVLRSDQCCPTCDDDVGSGQSDGSDLLVCRSPSGDDLYVEGETWSLDECMRCTCKHGRVLCHSEVCPPVLCHQPIKIKHSCCPICPADELNPLLPVNNSGQDYCVSSNGEILLAGESWRSNTCTSCTCRNGTIQCFHQRCPPAPCRLPVLLKGQCCPQCLDSEITTTSVPVMLPTTSTKSYKPKINQNTSTQSSLFNRTDGEVLSSPGQMEMNLIYQSAAWILAGVLLVVVMFLSVIVLINRKRDCFQMSCYNAPRKTVILKKHISKNSVVHMEPSRENQFNNSSDRISIPRAKLTNGHAEVHR